MLDFSRIERGQKTYRLEPAPLADVVQAAVRTIQYPLTQQGFALDLNVCEGIPPVAVDRDALQQAILNLLTNAMKYSGEHREIGLRLCSENGTALIQVSDRGIGIPEKEQSRIFEKFYRVPIPENREISGTGLGLSLVAHIAEAHGGSVQVKSRPGEGSTFSILLPLNAGGAGMSRVLVVEDDPAILQGLQESLRLERHDVLSASDGETGYRLAREKKPDLVILDLMLPKMGGFEICRKLRAEEFTAPILMLTARGDEADRVLGLDLGADDYVTKPFSVRELLARVRALLRRAGEAGQASGRAPVRRRRRGLPPLRSAQARRGGRADAEGIRRPAAARGQGGRGRVARRPAEWRLGLRELSQHAHGRHPHRPAAVEARRQSVDAAAADHGAWHGIQARDFLTKTCQRDYNARFGSP